MLSISTQAKATYNSIGVITFVKFNNMLIKLTRGLFFFTDYEDKVVLS